MAKTTKVKMKPRKRVQKRFKVTGSGKVMKRTAGQSHFNARDTGTKTRNKRRDQDVAKADAANVKKQLPYS